MLESSSTTMAHENDKQVNVAVEDINTIIQHVNHNDDENKIDNNNDSNYPHHINDNNNNGHHHDRASQSPSSSSSSPLRPLSPWSRRKERRSKDYDRGSDSYERAPHHHQRYYDDVNGDEGGYDSEERRRYKRRYSRHYRDSHGDLSSSSSSRRSSGKSYNEHRGSKRRANYGHSHDDNGYSSSSSVSSTSSSSSDSPYRRESKRKRALEHEESKKHRKSGWDEPQQVHHAASLANPTSSMISTVTTPASAILMPSYTSQSMINTTSNAVDSPRMVTGASFSTSPDEISVPPVQGLPHPHANALLFAQQLNSQMLPTHQQLFPMQPHYNHPRSAMGRPLLQGTHHDSQMNSPCRVYVGNIHFELSQEDVRRTFAPFGVIRNIMVSKDPVTQRHKGFCFIDFATPESAQNAINTMNGFMLAGRPLKLGRPRQDGASAPSALPATSPSTMPTTADNALKAAQEAAAQINSQALTPVNKIYVGSIHWDITEKDLISVFSAFGPVLSCHLSPNPETGKHRGYGFIEYATAEQAEEAIKSMNGFELAGRKLKVNKAVPGAASATMQLRQQQLIKQGLPATSHPIMHMSPNLQQQQQQPSHLAQAQQAALQIQQQALNQQQQQSLNVEEDLHIKGSSQRYMVMQKLLRDASTTPSRCILLNNMVGPGGDQDPQLHEEVTSECSKFGIVEKVVIYSLPSAVKIFVLFSDVEGATSARNTLDKRWFGGRMVDAQFYNVEKFIKGEYQ